MKQIISMLLFFLFGFIASMAGFSVARAAWNTPVAASVPVTVATWNDRDNKITELENRMNAIYNLLPGSVCGISKGGRNCSTLTRNCRPADPPPAFNWIGSDMLNPANCRLELGGIGW